MELAQRPQRGNPLGRECILQQGIVGEEHGEPLEPRGEFGLVGFEAAHGVIEGMLGHAVPKVPHQPSARYPPGEKAQKGG
jgi:hypothetical protein